jgi:adenosylmethionine-8-amino-7-oxononanoate aminotransferase
MSQGLMVYPMGGTVDGRYGDHVLLAPPFIIQEQEIDLLVDRLDRAIHDAIVSL